MSTLTQLADNVREKCKIDPQGDIWSDAELKTYINEGLTVFYSKANMKEEWKTGTIPTITAGTANYIRPADFRRLLWVVIVDTTATTVTADESPLEVVTDTLVEFQKGRDMDATGAVPQYFYEEGASLWIYPVPTAAAAAKYTVKYKYSKRPAVMGDTDSPEIPAEWHFVIEDYAVWRAWNKLPGKQDEAKIARDVWERNWRTAMQDTVWTTGEYQQFRMPTLPFKRRR